jgi:pyruvate-ferredoxin/flavodoxin oxidoreductase
VQKGVLATTFAASQDLLVMLPSMFKLPGELAWVVLHVACTGALPAPVEPW